MAKYKVSIVAFMLMFGVTAPLAAQPSGTVVAQEAEVRGAANIKVLANLMHQALQNTNFDPLRVHLADKQVYDGLLQLGSAPVREAIMLYTPDEMLIDFQRGFSDVIRAGMVLEVNWNQTELKFITADATPLEEAAILPVQLHLSSPGSPDFIVQFNAALLDGRYFYLPPLFIPNQDLD